MADKRTADHPGDTDHLVREQRGPIRPLSTLDLRPTERAFVATMTDLGFGRFEFLRIECGELVFPFAAVRNIRFGAEDPGTARTFPTDFDLKPQVVQLFAYVRSVEAGQIRTLEIRHGLPAVMEIEYRPGAKGDRRG